MPKNLSGYFHSLLNYSIVIAGIAIRFITIYNLDIKELSKLQAVKGKLYKISIRNIPPQQKHPGQWPGCFICNI